MQIADSDSSVIDAGNNVKCCCYACCTTDNDDRTVKATEEEDALFEQRLEAWTVNRMENTKYETKPLEEREFHIRIFSFFVRMVGVS